MLLTETPTRIRNFTPVALEKYDNLFDIVSKAVNGDEDLFREIMAAAEDFGDAREDDGFQSANDQLLPIIQDLQPPF